MGGGDFDGVCQVSDVISGVTAVKGRDAAVKAMTFLLKGLRIPKNQAVTKSSAER